MQQSQNKTIDILVRREPQVIEFYNSNVQFLTIRSEIEEMKKLRYSSYEMKTKVDNFKNKYRELVEKLFSAYCIHFVKKNYNVKDFEVLSFIENLHQLYRWKKSRDSSAYVGKKDVYKILHFLPPKNICWLMSACDII